MGAVGDLVKWVVWGRSDGVRAAIRERLGLFSWVDRDGAGPRPAPSPVAPPVDVRAGWTRLLASAELDEGAVVEVAAGGERIALVRREGTAYAVSGVCPHAAGPLGEGTLDGFELTCPVHGWVYDVRTGRCLVGTDVSIGTFRIVEDGGSVWLVA